MSATAHSDEPAAGLDLSAVARHLAGHGLMLDVAAGAPLLSGGLANLNHRVVVDGRPAVLRRPPAGPLPPGAHDMAREHHILSHLSRAFPLAPNSFHLCADRAVIGVPFQLIEFRTGTVIKGDRLPAEYASPASRRALSEELVTTLARFHAVDPDAVGLGEFGRPAGFFARNVEGWAKRAAMLDDPAPTAAVVTAIAEHLKARPPREGAATLLHSDFKLDNCMLDGAGRIGTIVDWDMGTRGDPLMDLATLMSYWAEPGDPACMIELAQMPTAHPGFLSRAEAVALYAGVSGRDVSDFPAWRVLAMFKLGVVFLQLHQNWKRGSIGDERYAGFGALGADLLAFTLDTARHG